MPSRKKSTRNKYPWDEWFLRLKTKPLILHAGKDYTCQAHGMAQQIRNVANHRNVAISILIENDTLTVSLT